MLRGDIMLAVNYSTIRSKLKDYCDKATDENETVIVTRKDEKNVVIMSLDKYNAIIKAARNAEYLDMIDRSMEQIKQGKVVVKTLEELEEMADE
jgi:antitoxin YefM